MPIKIIPKIMLIDMNSFFASVEQQANPRFRGKPLAVGNSLHNTSCLIGTSKEAKKLGIGTGTPMYKAKKICPGIIVVRSDPEKYREVNHQMNRIFRSYTKSVEAYSIDESFLDLSNSKLNPLAVGAEIKQRIREEIGEWLTCSIGVGENKFLSKLAADMEKPDGLSVIWREQLPEVYKNKRLTDLWGVARGWQKCLARLNIVSPGQVLGYPVQNLISLFGKPGYFIWLRINGFEKDYISDYSSPLTGEDVTIVTDEGETLSYPSPGASHHPLPQGEREDLKNQKSFGHSWVLNFRTMDKEKLKVVILRLAEKAARRMRREGFIAHGMYLSVLCVDGNGFSKSKKLKFSIETGLELYSEGLEIWKSWKFQRDIMHIAVGFTHLSAKIKQLSLFPNKTLNLTSVLDEINNKYGEFSIRSGLLTQTSDYSPDSIAFGK
jgi:DNA polymerase-4